MPTHAANGSINVSVVDGLTKVSSTAANGSMNVVSLTAPIQTSPQVGVYHASGAFNVVLNNSTTTNIGSYARNGAYNVSTNAGSSVRDPNGALRVTVVAGAL